MPETRKGKIARLPHDLRTDLNRRLRDNQTAAEILPWLNGQAAVKSILAASFSGEPISDQNLSNWRAGGYQDWLKQQERLDQIQSLSELSADMAAASGSSTADTACEIAGGRILEVLESLPQDDLTKILPALTALRNAQTAKLRAEIDNKRAGVSAETLALERQKWSYRAAETLLDAITDRMSRAQEIASSNVSRSEKIAQLVNEFLDQ
jgi:hypothetical protein